MRMNFIKITDVLNWSWWPKFYDTCVSEIQLISFFVRLFPLQSLIFIISYIGSANLIKGVLFIRILDHWQNRICANENIKILHKTMGDLMNLCVPPSIFDCIQVCVHILFCFYDIHWWPEYPTGGQKQTVQICDQSCWNVGHLWFCKFLLNILCFPCMHYSKFLIAI